MIGYDHSEEPSVREILQTTVSNKDELKQMAEIITRVEMETASAALDPALKPLPCFNNKSCTFQNRYKYANKIYNISKEFYPKTKTNSKAADKLKQKTRQEELNICKKSGSNITYIHAVTSLIKKIIINKGYKFQVGNNLGKVVRETDEYYSNLLTHLPSPKSLKNYGFEIVTKTEHENVVKEIDEQDSKNQILDFICARCETKYKSDKYEESGECNFHASRPFYQFGFKKYPCCDKSADGFENPEFCCNNKFHVYRQQDFKERSLISEYILEEDLEDGDKNILALDCEMGYTTKGYEMIRLTIVDFATEKSVFDKIIKPVGKVLDLNTKFSGVSEIPKDSLTFEEARKEYLNAKMINKNTIIVGHGLENDLQVMRITHSKIIDTCFIGYGKVGRRKPLKKMTAFFLNKFIQTGEHDSAEDAICALQIIKREYFNEFNFKINTDLLKWNEL
ncbi:hypothetical protein FOG51_03353 [Hanseniaspora uvarum]|uniref:RNA exonuclease 3 n=1 Tax=Hanseniaspora uvarum TaxID=29833 RepID=A0A1E5RUZ5_HANUV|nr:hypothetical protein FOG51_03353 [Hanseniaspora uvarum]KKA03592.1 RNA exonuclease 3 [Hanseniaspora uvarum DSM 2768]OEJ90751.1 RNA exonuclease 3 [Hanseniaspora uvarum]